MGWPETSLPSTQRCLHPSAWWKGRRRQRRVLSATVALPPPPGSQFCPATRPPSICRVSNECPSPTAVAQANFPSSIHWITLSADAHCSLLMAYDVPACPLSSLLAAREEAGMLALCSPVAASPSPLAAWLQVSQYFMGRPPPLWPG